MAREVQILTWCDNHGDEKVPGEAKARIHPVTGKPVKVDLCGQCDDQITALVAPVAALLDKFGTADKKPSAARRNVVKRPSAALPCKSKKCKERFDNFRALTLHCRANHPELMTDCPVCHAKTLDLPKHNRQKSHPVPQVA